MADEAGQSLSRPWRNRSDCPALGVSEMAAYFLILFCLGSALSLFVTHDPLWAIAFILGVRAILEGEKE